jgi:hypothetical protein
MPPLKRHLSMSAVNSALLIASHGDIPAVTQQNLVRAAALVCLTESIRKHLYETDPMALHQIITAIESAAGDFWV